MASTNTALVQNVSIESQVGAWLDSVGLHIGIAQSLTWTSEDDDRQLDMGTLRVGRVLQKDCINGPIEKTTSISYRFQRLIGFNSSYEAYAVLTKLLPVEACKNVEWEGDIWDTEIELCG